MYCYVQYIHALLVGNRRLCHRQQATCRPISIHSRPSTVPDEICLTPRWTRKAHRPALEVRMRFLTPPILSPVAVKPHTPGICLLAISFFFTLFCPYLNPAISFADSTISIHQLCLNLFLVVYYCRLANMSAAQPNEAEKNIEIWKVKKLIKRLEMARGNGTSMISLIIRMSSILDT